MIGSEQTNDPNQEQAEEQFDKVKLGAWEGLKKFFKELFDIRSDTDRDSTIEAIKKDISFKGHNAWILIFSIFIASIGLNVSSAAVVIGAMLISPLMGPIVGVGLSVAVNDVDTMRRSLINLGVMVGLSVLTAFFYFALSPLTEETPELVARTYPTILDVLVAIFGGLGLIVAKTKSGTIASVIFGVAIATALMPPLCTVGYGLAVGNPQYALGALYLFSINAVFIALATFIVSKLLRFPMVKYANSKRRRRIAQIASLIAFIVMVPSVILFINLLDKQLFENRTREFVRQSVRFEGAEVVKYTQDYEAKTLYIYLIGKRVPQPEVDFWEAQLKNEVNEEYLLQVYQHDDQTGEFAERLSDEVRSGILEDLYVRNEEIINDKNARITFLENEIAKLKVKDIPFDELSAEAKINYSGLTSFAYAKKVVTDFTATDTLPVFEVQWDRSVSRNARRDNNERLANWLKFKLKLDTVVVAEQP